jgi:preprotein translocase subunit SecD
LSLTLYIHPLASFCHKVLIAFYENSVPFRPVTVDLLDPEQTARHLARWPVGRIPVLHDSARGRILLAKVLLVTLVSLVVGVISSIALGVNLLLLVALLSLLQATLTLPGIAAIALTLGMAIDANVLINERIREELRGGATPQAAIAAGYERAWGTILDSNVTTLIAGLALLIFGQGPVRGFAVVHCLGILTSMFSAVTVSRAMVNLVYGHRRRVAKLAIGDTGWK